MGAEGLVIVYERTIDEVRCKSSNCEDCTNLAFERLPVDYVTPVKADGGREMFTVEVGVADGWGSCCWGDMEVNREVIALPVQSSSWLVSFQL